MNLAGKGACVSLIKRAQNKMDGDNAAGLTGAVVSGRAGRGVRSP